MNVTARLLSFVLTTLVAPAGAMAAQPASEKFDASASKWIARIAFSGAEGISRDTLLSLLPRALPARYTEQEIVEYERRLNNLNVFDRVNIEVRDAVLAVELRKKFTLSPLISLSTGRTLRDTYLLLGADEYNAFRRVGELGGYASYSERAPNAEAWYYEHAYDPRKLAPFVNAIYFTSSLRFADNDTLGWMRSRAGLFTGFYLPYGYGSPLRFQVGIQAYSETYFDVSGPVTPRSGVYLGNWIEGTWDRFTFRDLAASGFRVSLRVQPGALAGPAQPRHRAQVRYLQGIAFSKTTVLMIQGIGDVYTSGNPNWSALVGSISGVRGLSDAYYRNDVQAVGNLELRQAWRFAERWALQGVLFTDAAVFRSMDERGRRGDWTSAIGTGVGARLIPTFLTSVVLRVDSAWLHTPESTWLVQTGLDQYF